MFDKMIAQLEAQNLKAQKNRHCRRDTGAECSPSFEGIEMKKQINHYWLLVSLEKIWD